jgi:hypothetical protein
MRNATTHRMHLEISGIRKLVAWVLSSKCNSGRKISDYIVTTTDVVGVSLRLQGIDINMIR